MIIDEKKEMRTKQNKTMYVDKKAASTKN